MAITSATHIEHTHSGGNVFLGRSAPVNEHGDVPTPGAFWLVSELIAITPGAPTTFSPASLLPQDLNALQALGNLGQGAAWDPTHYLLLKDGTTAAWDGTKWIAGQVTAPLATTVTVGMPGTFGPANHRAPNVKAELDTINGGASWVAPGAQGRYVTVGGQDYYWDGAAWVAGRSPLPLATSATTGRPGTFTFGHRPPADQTELQSVTASPATLWAQGEYVVVAGSPYHWSGTAWAAGVAPAPPPAPLATTATAGSPGTFGPAGSRAPTTVAELGTIMAGTAWTTPGDYVAIGPLASDEYHWTGATWKAGRVQGIMLGNRQIVADPIRNPPPAPVADTLPTELQFSVYAGPSYSMRWNAVDATALGGVAQIVVRFVSRSSGAQLARFSMRGGSTDVTTSVLANQIPGKGDYVYLDFTYGDGSTQTLRAEVA